MAVKDYVVLNYQQVSQTQVTAKDIENSIPPAAMNELLKDDPNPFYSVEAIRYPVIGNTHLWGVQGTYEEPYFESLAESLKSQVIPGSKDGHSTDGKPANDFFLVGMKLVKNGDGTGTAYLKNYIPPLGFSGDNHGLIRDAKLGLLRFSLVSKPIYDQGKINSLNEYHIIGTRGGDRNDAVEEGAMAQTVNDAKAANPYPGFHAARMVEPGKFDEESFRTKILDKTTGLAAIMGKLKGESSMTIQAYRFPKDKYTAEEARKWLKDHDLKPVSFEKAKEENASENFDYELTKALAANGQCTRDDVNGQIIQEGRVSYLVLRRMVANAACENKSQISEIISIIDKKTNGGRNVDTNEAIGVVGNALANNSVSVAEIAKKCGMEKFIRNDADDKNAELAKALNALNLGEKPIEAISALIAENSRNAELAATNAVVAAYGPAEKEINGVKTKNAAHAYALGKVTGKTGKALDDAMNALKDDVVLKAIRGNQADPFMQTIITENANDSSPKSVNGIQVIEIGGKK